MGERALGLQKPCLSLSLVEASDLLVLQSFPSQ